MGEVEITRTEKATTSKSKEKPVAVEPLSPEELKQILSQSKKMRMMTALCVVLNSFKSVL